MSYNEQVVLASFLNDENLECLERVRGTKRYTALFDELKRQYKANKLINLNTLAKNTGVPLVEILKLRGQSLSSQFDSALEELDKRYMVEQIQLAVKGDNPEIKIGEILEDYNNHRTAGLEKPMELAEAFMEGIQTRLDDVPLAYGVPTLDKVTGGLHKQELTIIGARPSVGKTALALQIAIKNARQGYKVAFFSLEMSAYQLTSRILGYDGFNTGHLKNIKAMTNEQHAEMQTFVDKLPQNLDVFEKTFSISAMVRILAEGKYDLAVVDYVQLIKPSTRKNSKKEEVDEISRELKLATKNYEIPIILLSQIGRTASDKPPTISELKESGALEQDADNIILLHRLTDAEIYKTEFSTSMEYFKLNKIEVVDINLAKHRNGERKALLSVYKGQEYKFIELDRRGN